jgi:hypothetical protein
MVEPCTSVSCIARFSRGDDAAPPCVCVHGCSAGSYCVSGRETPCPAGRFGSVVNLSAALCSGPCEQGHFCPTGSTRANQTVRATISLRLVVELTSRSVDMRRSRSRLSVLSQMCGAGSRYCPTGASNYSEVPLGYFSFPDVTPLQRYGISECPSGYYCQNGEQVRASRGHRQLLIVAVVIVVARVVVAQMPCMAGKWSSAVQRSTPCVADCQAGYYCVDGSSSPSTQRCGAASRFCPQGSGTYMVAAAGNYTAGGVDATTRTHQRVCLSPADMNGTAVFCVDGVISVCPAGTFGVSGGLNSSLCSGLCTAGHTCHAGSNSSTAQSCGNATL